MVYDDIKFKGQDYSDLEPEGAEFDHCVFENCIFNNSELSSKNFIDCSFENCHFSLTKIINTVFQDTEFKDCKILGLDFSVCNPYIFTPAFLNCIINYSNFSSLKMQNTGFSSCQIKETDFSNSNIKNGKFDNCDLGGSIFYHTNLNNVSFQTAYNYTIHPEDNSITGAEFDINGLPGLLAKYKIKIVI